MKTYATKLKDIKRTWFLIDAKDKVLGRLAARIASILRGKHKIIYTPHLDTGDYCVVVNAKYIRFTGKKPKQKIYSRYSGYPGGKKDVVLEEMFSRKPTEVLSLAVRRMLPNNTLGREMFKKLKIYPEAEHKQKAQNPIPLNL